MMCVGRVTGWLTPYRKDGQPRLTPKRLIDPRPSTRWLHCQRDDKVEIVCAVSSIRGKLE